MALAAVSLGTEVHLAPFLRLVEEQRDALVSASHGDATLATPITSSHTKGCRGAGFARKNLDARKYVFFRPSLRFTMHVRFPSTLPRNVALYRKDYQIDIRLVYLDQAAS